MKRIALLALTAAIFSTGGAVLTAQDGGAAASPGAMPDEPWRAIDVAIVLDTSGSMEFLIESARTKLWELVLELESAEPRPVVRAAIVTYGSKANGAAAGWVKVETDFTSDLDRVSDTLLSVVQDHGGTEYVTRAMREAVTGLAWTPSDEALKLLLVAGNEPADQDAAVPPLDIAAQVLDAGIAVQLIFCGQADVEHAQSWKDLAELADGEFATMDKSTAPSVETPFDAELLELGAAINQTYVPLGESGGRRMRNLVEQDRRVHDLSAAAAASRVEVKSGRFYAAGWDLVTVFEAGNLDVTAIDPAELPADLRTLGAAELEAYLAELADLRSQVRRRIETLSAQRRTFIVSQIEARGIDTSRSFDRVILESLRGRLAQHGFRIAGE